jgi:hypothetical protein
MIAAMGATGGESGSGAVKPRALAFYLPQFHPIPENDEWWGRGFTEWVNVTRAKPLYPGHRQPHVPSELGYYDLRVPEVREAQAALAAEHGIHGFVYYHYWFHGHRLLERPFDEVLASGSPDFPFALCWANEEWTRNWDAKTGEVLMAQDFSDEDDLAHIRWLCTAFADDRYIKIDGRPLMLIYRAAQLPDAKRTADIWRSEARRQGFPDLYLCWVDSHGPPKGGPAAFGLDATVAFMPLESPRIFAPDEPFRGNRILDYTRGYEAELRRAAPPWKRFPSVMVEWDNSPRRPFGATIYEGATPDAFRRWLSRAVASVADVREEENYLFILAWNEWAEGNHLEPDTHYGRAFLEATRSVLLETPVPARGPQAPESEPTAIEDDQDAHGSAYVYRFRHDSAVANAAELVRGLDLGPGRALVDLGAGTAVVKDALADIGIRYHGIEIDPESIDLMRAAGTEVTRCDLTDTAGVRAALDDIRDVGAIMFLDVLEHLMEPQELLTSLSEWALKHGEPALIVSAPNATHFDVGLRLLCGRWIPTRMGLLDSTHIRFFSQVTLERLLERCGWSIVSRNDYRALRSDQYDHELNDGLPIEMVGALHVMAEACNPSASVQQFVWALRPTPVLDAPASYLDAVRELPEDAQAEHEPDADLEPDFEAVRRYLTSVGLVASETNRRAAKQLRFGLGPRWKRSAVKAIERSPAIAAAYRRARRWLP